MSSERAAQARALLEKRRGNAVTGGTLGVNTKAVSPKVDASKFSHVHPEVLDHVTKFLQDFQKRLTHGK